MQMTRSTLPPLTTIAAPKTRHRSTATDEGTQPPPEAIAASSLCDGDDTFQPERVPEALLMKNVMPLNASALRDVKGWTGQVARQGSGREGR